MCIRDSCEGVVLAEETYKDLEMVATTEGTLKVFISKGFDNFRGEACLLYTSRCV